MSRFVLGEAKRGSKKEDYDDDDDENSDNISEGDEELSDDSEFTEDSFLELTEEDRKRKRKKQRKKEEEANKRKQLEKFIAQQEARVSSSLTQKSDGKRKRLVPKHSRESDLYQAHQDAGEVSEGEAMVTISITVTRGTTFCDVATPVTVPRRMIKDLLPSPGLRSTFMCSYRTNRISKKSSAVTYPGITYLFGNGHFENSRMGMHEYPYQKMVDTAHRDAVSRPWPLCHIFYRDMTEQEAATAEKHTA